MKSKATIGTAVLTILLLGALAGGAENQHQVAISGRVLPAFSLEPVAATADAGQQVFFVPQGRDRVLVRIDRSAFGASSDGIVRVVLALRTNAEEFRLRGAQVSGLTPVEVSFGEAQPSGHLVAPGAASGFAPAGGPLASGQEELLATGSRISQRGSFSSPNNALLVPVELRLNSAVEPGSYQILLSLGQ